MLTDDRFGELLRTRAERPDTIRELAAARVRRPLIRGDGRLLIVAMDHPPRGVLGVGADPMAMADRREVLNRTLIAVNRPGVDGILATPDIVEDLLLLGELDDRLVFGSMNRGGLAGSAWELDDRFTSYDATSIAEGGLDGGKMLLRLDHTDPATIDTIVACAQAITDLAGKWLPAMLEPLPVFRDGTGAVKVSLDIEDVVRAVSIAGALGSTSAHTWLKLPAVAEPEKMMAATTLPALLLGGDPAGREEELEKRWRRSMAIPNVRGLVAGRSLLFPSDGDVARAVDVAAGIVHGP